CSTGGTSLLIHATNTLEIDKRNDQALHKQPNKSAAPCASLLVSGIDRRRYMSRSTQRHYWNRSNNSVKIRLKSQKWTNHPQQLERIRCTHRQPHRGQQPVTLQTSQVHNFSARQHPSIFTALRTRSPVSPPPLTKSQHPHRRRTGKQERSTKTAIYEGRST
ncbi:unnamed protein product, partial [Ectocarpus sp. 4 AP-2014]